MPSVHLSWVATQTITRSPPSAIAASVRSIKSELILFFPFWQNIFPNIQSWTLLNSSQTRFHQVCIHVQLSFAPIHSQTRRCRWWRVFCLFSDVHIRQAATEQLESVARDNYVCTLPNFSLFLSLIILLCLPIARVPRHPFIWTRERSTIHYYPKCSWYCPQKFIDS